MHMAADQSGNIFQNEHHWKKIHQNCSKNLKKFNFTKDKLRAFKMFAIFRS